MTLTEPTQRPGMLSIDEEFAVLLEEHDETAWKKLLREVGGLIRKMLADKATHEHIVRELEYDDDTDSEVDDE